MINIEPADILVIEYVAQDKTYKRIGFHLYANFSTWPLKASFKSRYTPKYFITVMYGTVCPEILNSGRL